MIEQLDLFATSEEEKEEQENKKVVRVTQREIEMSDLFNGEEQQEDNDKLTDRQKALLKYIEENSLIHHRKTTQKEICEYINGYEWNDDEKCHDHCPAVWKDIKDINLSDETDYVIISKDFEYWIGSKRETKAFIAGLWKALSPRLKRYWKYFKKLGLEGQQNVFTEEFYEVFNKYDVEMQKQLGENQQ